MSTGSGRGGLGLSKSGPSSLDYRVPLTGLVRASLRVYYLTNKAELGNCPHTVTLYSRAIIKSLTCPYDVYYSTVTEWGQYLSYEALKFRAGGFLCFGACKA